MRVRSPGFSQFKAAWRSRANCLQSSLPSRGHSRKSVVSNGNPRWRSSQSMTVPTLLSCSSSAVPLHRPRRGSPNPAEPTAADLPASLLGSPLDRAQDHFLVALVLLCCFPSSGLGTRSTHISFAPSRSKDRRSGCAGQWDSSLRGLCEGFGSLLLSGLGRPSVKRPAGSGDPRRARGAVGRPAPSAEETCAERRGDLRRAPRRPAPSAVGGRADLLSLQVVALGCGSRRGLCPGSAARGLATSGR